MQTYSEYRPTQFDPKGAFLRDQRDWLVVPVVQTRDSGPLSQSNYAVALRELDAIDPNHKDHVDHRFAHWGPGWFEIIIEKPGPPCAVAAKEMESALADYPVLDESDYSEREYEEACSAWEWTDRRDRIAICAKHGVSIFAARRDEIPDGPPYFDDFYPPTD